MNDELDNLMEEDGELDSYVQAEDTAEVSADIAKLTQALEQKAKEAAEEHDKYIRTSADFDNYRKRMQRDFADFRKYANEQMARELLSVLDHLSLAIKHAAEAGESNDGLRQGVELVHKQLRDVLEKFGIVVFASQGEPFDPSKHDAIMQETTDAVPENTVVQVFQEGYLYHDKVLRHARVSVSKKPAAENKTESMEEHVNE
ncbi:MAG TPA: nucleotide exchange factor GrpE [Nitrospirota bacterium]|nr:nucleotide exchange factor GrpE [Nitrospirota bacterium]